MGQAAIPASILGGSVISSLFAPEGQEIQSFGTGSDRDPNRDISAPVLLRDARDAIGQLAEYFTSRLNDPAQLTTTVPSLPSYVGGALPMAVGAPAQDLALSTPSILSSRSGTSVPSPLIRPLPGSRTPGGATPETDTGRTAQPRSPEPTLGLLPGGGTTEPGDDPMERNLMLLFEALRPR